MRGLETIRVKGATTAFSTMLFVSVVGAVAFAVWFWMNAYDRRARASHLENGKAYAARVLERIGTLPDALSESSGLVVSRTQANVLWSHNDSGDSPNIYAIEPSGRLLAVISVKNAVARDWEDMAAGPCPPSIVASDSRLEVRGDCLYLADIGDNDRVREALTVYVIREPRLGRTEETSSTAEAQSFRFRYPDAPHDSEAFAVLPNGDVAIVSKDRTGTIDFFGIRAASLARALTSGEVLVAEYEGDTGIEPDARIGRLATGAAMSPDGKTIAVRTYNEVFFYAAVVGQRGRGWLDLRRPCFFGDVEPQGEGIDYLDTETLLLTSERARGLPATIYRLRC